MGFKFFIPQIKYFINTNKLNINFYLCIRSNLLNTPLQFQQNVIEGLLFLYQQFQTKIILKFLNKLLLSFIHLQLISVVSGLMPDLFDALVVGTMGLIGFGCYLGFNQSQAKIRQTLGLSQLTRQELQEMKRANSDAPIKKILNNARAQPYNNLDMELIPCWRPSKQKKAGQASASSSTPMYGGFTDFSSRNFARLTFPLTSHYPSKFRLQIKQTKINTQILDRELDPFKGDVFTFSRLATFTIIGAVGYDYDNQQFFVRAFTIGKNISQILSQFENEKVLAVAVAVTSFIIGGLVLIFKGAIMASEEQRRNRLRAN